MIIAERCGVVNRFWSKKYGKTENFVLFSTKAIDFPSRQVYNIKKMKAILRSVLSYEDNRYYKCRTVRYD